MADDQEKKIVSDDDWKTQARREKERLAEKEKQAQAQAQPKEAPAEGDADAQRPPLPPASLRTLLNTFAVQGLFYMGRLPGPDGKPGKVDMELAKHQIDMLGVIEEKTKGNLSDEEEQELAGVLHELRMQFVQVAQQ